MPSMPLLPRTRCDQHWNSKAAPAAIDRKSISRMPLIESNRSGENDDFPIASLFRGGMAQRLVSAAELSRTVRWPPFLQGLVQGADHMIAGGRSIRR